jgi:hypothetical protein
MEHILSWKATSASARQVILYFLCNLKVHYCAHKTLPLIPVLSHMNPIHILPSSFWKINVNVVLSVPGSCKWSLSLRFSSQIPILRGVYVTLSLFVIIIKYHNALFSLKKLREWPVEDMEGQTLNQGLKMFKKSGCFQMTKIIFVITL